MAQVQSNIKEAELILAQLNTVLPTVTYRIEEANMILTTIANQIEEANTLIQRMNEAATSTMVDFKEGEEVSRAEFISKAKRTYKLHMEKMQRRYQQVLGK